MEIDYDVTEQAIALLLPQFAEKKRVKGLFTGVLSPSDEVVSGINDITNGYDIDTAVGEQLTKLATLLNVKRNERTDDELRAAVKARIIINKSTGSAANFIEMLGLVLGDIRFTVIEQYPASVQVIIYSPQNIVDEDIVNDITPIGVRGIFFENPTEGKTIFEFGDESGGSVTGGTPMVNITDLGTTDVVMVNIAYS